VCLLRLAGTHVLLLQQASPNMCSSNCHLASITSATQVSCCKHGTHTSTSALLSHSTCVGSHEPFARAVGDVYERMACMNLLHMWGKMCSQEVAAEHNSGPVAWNDPRWMPVTLKLVTFCPLHLRLDASVLHACLLWLAEQLQPCSLCACCHWH